MSTHAHQVVEITDGEGLLAQLTLAEPVDLVISDIRMPGKSGLEVLDSLRDQECLPAVILMTAFGCEVTRAEATRLGARAVLSKPFGLGELRGAVRAILGP